MKFNVLAMKRDHNNAMINNRKQARIISAVTEYFGGKILSFHSATSFLVVNHEDRTR